MDNFACRSLDHVSRRTLLRAAGASGLLWLTPIAERLANPDSFAGVKKLSAVVNIAVEDLVVMRLLDGIRANFRFANFNSARAEIGKFAMRDKIALATAAKLQSVAADVFESAVFK